MIRRLASLAGMVLLFAVFGRLVADFIRIAVHPVFDRDLRANTTWWELIGMVGGGLFGLLLSLVHYARQNQIR